jgi:hypothetical protein
MAGISSNSYSSGMFMLELEGEPAGRLRSVEGGEPFAVVQTEDPTDGITPKHLGSVHITPITVTFGVGMSKRLYDWMAAFLGSNGSAKSGAIYFGDFSSKEHSRLVFQEAKITELSFPALVGGSDDAAFFTLTIQPEKTRTSLDSVGNTIPGFGPKTRKQWRAGDFILKIDGLEDASARVSAIDAIVVKQGMKKADEMEIRDPGVKPDFLVVPDLTVTVASSRARAFYDYFEGFVIQGNPKDERQGKLEFLDVSLKKKLFVLEFHNMGIFRIQNVRVVDHAEVLAKVNVGFYCEGLSLTTGDETSGSVLDQQEPAQQHAPPSGTDNKNLAGALAAIISDSLSGDAAIRSAMRSAILQRNTTSDREADSALVASRLLETVRPVKPTLSVQTRDAGSSLGEQWATQRATLAELNGVAALEDSEWSAIRLEGGHSLIAELREAGFIPYDDDDAVDLERDSFVEGLVAGASSVLRNAAPHLNLWAPKKQSG